MRYIVGPLIIIAGVLIMKYTVDVTNFTGKISFAEDYLRPIGAGTYTFWRLFGLLIIVLAVLWMTGRLEFQTGALLNTNI